MTDLAEPRDGELDPDLVEALEEHRDFLLRSLDDLEREHEAGDVDDADYEALKDDYTARAARVIRAIERRRARFVAPRPRAAGHRGRTVAWIVGVVAFALLAGVMVARAAGRRDVGEVASGDVRRSVTEDLNRGRNLAAAGDRAGAVEVLDGVVERAPDNPEARTYRGWFRYLDGDQQGGLTDLLAAATAHPDYPDVHAFLAIVFYRGGLVAEADRELARLDALDPPAELLGLLTELRNDIEADLAEAGAGAATTTVAPTAQRGGGT
ncbi:MAG: hypothetical protein AB7L84_08370 [Acidimicrobiia bacterium]